MGDEGGLKTVYLHWHCFGPIEFDYWTGRLLFFCDYFCLGGGLFFYYYFGALCIVILSSIVVATSTLFSALCMSHY